MLCYAGTARFNELIPSLQSVLTGDYTRLGELSSHLQHLSPPDQQDFRGNRLFGLLFSHLFSQLITVQFSGSRFLETVVQILLWLTLGRVPEKEETPLLRTLKMCTSRDAVRFPDKELREILLRMCGCESEKYTEIGWLYREYCMQWLSMVGFSPSFERSALTRRT